MEEVRAMRTWKILVPLLALLLVLSACGGSPQPDPAPVPDPAPRRKQPSLHLLPRFPLRRKTRRMLAKLKTVIVPVSLMQRRPKRNLGTNPLPTLRSLLRRTQRSSLANSSLRIRLIRSRRRPLRKSRRKNLFSRTPRRKHRPPQNRTPSLRLILSPLPPLRTPRPQQSPWWTTRSASCTPLSAGRLLPSIPPAAWWTGMMGN